MQLDATLISQKSSILVKSMLLWASHSASSFNLAVGNVINQHIYVTSRHFLSFCEKRNAYNRAFATKFATFLRAVPNMVCWGHSKSPRSSICKVRDVIIQAFEVTNAFSLVQSLSSPSIACPQLVLFDTGSRKATSNAPNAYYLTFSSESSAYLRRILLAAESSCILHGVLVVHLQRILLASGLGCVKKVFQEVNGAELYASAKTASTFSLSTRGSGKNGSGSATWSPKIFSIQIMSYHRPNL